MADRAADGAHVANQWIGDERRGIQEDVERPTQVRRTLHIAMTGAGSDQHMPVFSTNSLEAVNFPNIDDDDRSRKS